MESYHHFDVQTIPAKRTRSKVLVLFLSSVFVSTSFLAAFRSSKTLDAGLPSRTSVRTTATTFPGHRGLDRISSKIQPKIRKESITGERQVVVQARGETVSPESSPDPKKKENEKMNSFLTNAITNSAEAFRDALAGAKQCSNSQQCRRLHAFDDRVGPECCSFGVVNMCCFASDDDDDFRGGFGRPLPPELQLEPALIPIPVHNPEQQGYPRGGGGYGGGGGGYGGYPY
mmetsp:Transcript_13721/g.27771  ORF Transcript_13721/g.27771 Transcript_13721/m.27771 type:complete len:230 (+) Transcript_13721:88-777(+)